MKVPETPNKSIFIVLWCNQLLWKLLLGYFKFWRHN